MADPISQQGLYQDGNSIFENVFILGALEVSGIVNTETTIKASKFIGDGSELSGIDATTIKDSAGNTQIQGTTTGATHSGRAVFDELEVENRLYDGDGNFGTSGQVLSSDGTDTAWVNTGSLTAGAASEVGITAVNTDSDHFLTFVDSSSGNDNVKVDANLKYNPSSNTIATIKINDLQLVGELKDGDNAFGASGTVLTSDGTDTKWANVGTLAAGSAAKLSVTEDDTETDGRLLFSNAAGQTGGNTVKSDDQLTYNASTNVLTGGTFAGNVSGGDGVFNDLTVNGELKDGDGNFGSSGQVLTSDGTDTKWDYASALTAGVSSKVTLTATNTTDSTHFPVFVDTATGDEDVRTDSGFTYNPSSGTLTATTFSGAFSLSAGTGAITNPARLGAGSVAAGRLTSNSVISGNIVDDAVTFAKLQQIPSTRLIGRSASGNGDATHLDMSTVKAMLGTITNATNAANLTLTPNNNDTNFHCLFSMGSFQSSAQNASVLFDSGSYTYNPNDNRLNLSKLQVHQISPSGTYDAGSSNQVLIATGGTPGLDWGPTISSVASNSTIVQRHSSGYIFANYFNTTPNDIATGSITKICAESGNDGYIRHASAAAVRSFLNVADGATNTPNISNNNQLTNGAGYVTSSGNTVIGTDADINTSGATVVDQLNMTDGVITSHSTRTMTLANLGFTGQANGHVRRVREVANGSEQSRGNGSTSYSTRISTTFTSVPSDSRFIVFVNFAIRSSSSNTNRRCEARVAVSGGGLLNNFTKSTNQNSYTEDNKFSYMEFDTAANTSNRTYSLQYRSTHVNEGCSIRHASLVVIEFKPN